MCTAGSDIPIQINHDVRPDSNLTLQAAIEVVEEEGFEDLLNNVRDRIDEIESLHRTRELTVRLCPPLHTFRTDIKASSRTLIKVI